MLGNNAVVHGRAGEQRQRIKRSSRLSESAQWVLSQPGNTGRRERERTLVRCVFQWASWWRTFYPISSVCPPALPNSMFFLHLFRSCRSVALSSFSTPVCIPQNTRTFSSSKRKKVTTDRVLPSNHWDSINFTLLFTDVLWWIHWQGNICTQFSCLPGIFNLEKFIFAWPFDSST